MQSSDAFAGFFAGFSTPLSFLWLPGKSGFHHALPILWICWWDLLVSREQNFLYETLQVWGTAVCSGGALLPLHCPKCAARPAAALVLPWCLTRGSVRSSPRWISQKNRLNWQQCWDNRTLHSAWCHPFPCYCGSQDTAVAIIATLLPFLWPSVTCFKRLKIAVCHRGWVCWHYRLSTVPHCSPPAAMRGAQGLSHQTTHGIHLGTWRCPHGRGSSTQQTPEHRCSSQPIPQGLARSQPGS